MAASLRKRGQFLSAALAVCILATGCGRVPLDGVVRSAEGEPLPGVAVRVDESGEEALTNALGQYRLQVSPGEVTIRYSKSGYAPSAAAVQANADATLQLNEVSLWVLPRSKGVYAYRQGRYEALVHAEPRQYLLDDDAADFAIRPPRSTPALSNDASILCYNMPRYEARVSRLEARKAALRTGQEFSLDVLARAASAPVTLEAVDNPEGMLLRARFERALDPGMYALHWGALDGESALDARVYLFEVESPPETPAESAPEAER